MIDNSEEFKLLINTVTEIIRADNLDSILDLLVNSQITIEQTGYNNWNGGMYDYTIYICINVKKFIMFRIEIEAFEGVLLERFNLVTRHIDNECIARVAIVPKSSNVTLPSQNPHRSLSASEMKTREYLITYLENASEDELIGEVLIPLFRQLGFHRLTVAGHKDKLLEYGKDVWMRFTLPTQHVLYFGIQAKKGKIDASGMPKATNMNVAELHQQALMMLGHEVFDSEIGKRVLVDHAFIVSGGEITKAARNWIGERLDVTKRSQIMFMDKEDILNLYVVNNVPLPSGAIPAATPIQDDLPF